MTEAVKVAKMVLGKLAIWVVLNSSTITVFEAITVDGRVWRMVCGTELIGK